MRHQKKRMGLRHKMCQPILGLDKTAYVVVYLFDNNNVQVHRYEAATIDRALEIVNADWAGYSAPIGAEAAGLELPIRASRCELPSFEWTQS